MTVERELGALTEAIKSLDRGQSALFNKFEALDGKVDTITTAQAVLLDQHQKNRRLSGGAILAAFSAVLAVTADWLRGH